MKTKPVSIPEDLYSTISAEAKTRGVSISLVATEYLQAGLARATATPQPGKKDLPQGVEQIMGMNLL